MRAALKIAGWVLGILVVAAGGVVASLALRKPSQRPAALEQIERTPERIARGRYVAENLSGCIDCHSDRNPTWAMPPKRGTEGQGGFVFDEKFGVPGKVCAQNITPDRETGKGTWTDGELVRAIREGVDREGGAVFPMMPYEYFHEMSDEDARSVVAYLRTLPAIKHEVPPRTLAFPVNLLVKLSPRPILHPVETPDDAKDHHAYGKYLVAIALCMDCHTAHDDHGQRLPGREFAGGWVMRGPWGTVVTANLTPHPETFVGRATKAEFIGRFKSLEAVDDQHGAAAAPGRNTVMPWYPYSRLTEKDLGAIYDYLRTLPPIENKIDSFPEAATASR